MSKPRWWNQARQRLEAKGLNDHEAERAYEASVLEELRNAGALKVDDLPDEAHDRLLLRSLELWPIAREFYASLDAGVGNMIRDDSPKDAVRASAKHLARELPDEMSVYVFSTTRAEERAEVASKLLRTSCFCITSERKK